MNFWLMKSEPDAFSIDDLASRPGRREPWDGIRNYQARNMMRDDMAKGDLVFFYHSSCEVPAVVGVMEVVSGAYPDPTQFDADSRYYDPKSSPDNPRWILVDVRFRRKFRKPVTLTDIRAEPRLSEMRLVQRGNRLSIMPVTAREWKVIFELAGYKPLGVK